MNLRLGGVEEKKKKGGGRNAGLQNLTRDPRGLERGEATSFGH